MGWFLLFIAITFEVAGTTCMKLSDGFTQWVPSVLLFLFYGLSFTSFVYALKTIDLSISYAIWAGLGLALITVVSIVFFNEKVTVLRMASMCLVLVGVVGLGLSQSKI